MAPLIYLDTHVTVWLFAGESDLLPPQARARIEELKKQQVAVAAPPKAPAAAPQPKPAVAVPPVRSENFFRSSAVTLPSST